MTAQPGQPPIPTRDNDGTSLLVPGQHSAFEETMAGDDRLVAGFGGREESLSRTKGVEELLLRTAKTLLIIEKHVNYSKHRADSHFVDNPLTSLQAPLQ